MATCRSSLYDRQSNRYLPANVPTFRTTTVLLLRGSFVGDVARLILPQLRGKKAEHSLTAVLGQRRAPSVK